MEPNDPPDGAEPTAGPYDSVREQERIAEAVRRVSSGSADVPRWWRVEMERFNEGTPGLAPPLGGLKN